MRREERGNRVTRIVTWARLRDRAGGGAFYVFNTHWDHESQIARERSAALLLARIAARRCTEDPVLVMGDFNVGEDNPAFRALVGTDAGLRETFRMLHPDATEVGTYHGFAGESAGDKVDAILASPEWKVFGAAIVRTNRHGHYPSDHFPVTATLALGQ